MSNERANAELLTKSRIDKAEPRASRYVMWDAGDGAVKGFGVRIEPSGAKTYIVRYRAGAGGRTADLRQYRIGRITDPKLTVTEARKRASAVLAEVKTGRDPQDAITKQRQALTVSALCDEYERLNPARKKPTTVTADKGRIAVHIKPLIGKRRLCDVTRADIEKMMRAIERGDVQGSVSSRRYGGPGAAARTVGLLQGIFKWAVERGDMAANPAHGVKRPKDRSVERFLSSEELARFADTIGAMAARVSDGRAEGNIFTEAHADVLRLLLLTGARKNEIAKLRRADLHLAAGTIRLKDSKTGEKTIYLNAGAREILAKYADGPGEWVFPRPGDRTHPLHNIDWAWACARKEARLGDVRIHDLRHSFASIGLRAGLPLAFIGRLLGHKHAATTSRYSHLARDAIAEAADSIGGAIAGAMSGKSADIKRMRPAS